MTADSLAQAREPAVYPVERGADDEGHLLRAKPRFRGVSHQIAFFVWLPLGLGLLLTASGAAFPEIAIYCVAIAGLFGVSALFHRRTWSPSARRRMRRLDHSMIFLAIAGTYTAVAGLALEGPARLWVLGLVWIGAGLGIGTKLLWIDAPKWVSAIAYVVIGWIAVLALPQLVEALGWGGFALLLAGGLLYTLGAVVYARQRPDPIPSVFGYHEVFHGFVIGGAGCHAALVGLVVLPGL